MKQSLMQIGELHSATLFDIGVSINALSSKFYSKMQHQLTVLPTSRKVVSADSDNLQCDIILQLPWEPNYRISCTWNQEGKHFITIKNQCLALSIAPPVPGQLAKLKDNVHYKVDQSHGFLYRHQETTTQKYHFRFTYQSE